ncbi:MAG: DNA polymerase I [Bacillota bacterium]
MSEQPKPVEPVKADERLRKAVFIDGNSLANRAFFALPSLTTPDGTPTGGVYGFLTMLLRLLDEERPDYLAVAFDKSAPTFRHQAYEQYKANRTGAPDDLRTQFPILKDVLRAFNVPLLELEGYEADDILGTMAERAEAAGLETLIFTGDRDSLQLVDDQTKAILTVKGISETKVFDAAAVTERYGVRPDQFVDVKGLMGDTSDNIPGIPGVGEKTATKLVSQYGSLEEVLAHADEVSGPKLRELLKTYADQARLSKQLATIDRQVPIDADLGAMARHEPDWPAFIGWCRRLEFRTLVPRLEKMAGKSGRAGAAPSVPGVPSASTAPPVESGAPAFAPPAKTATVRADALPALAAKLAALRGFAFFTALDAARPTVARPKGFGLAIDGEAVHVPAACGDGLFAADELFPPALAPAFEDARVAKQGHDLKATHVLLRRAGYKPAGLAFDTALAAYLVDATRGNYSVESLTKERFGTELPPLEGPRGAALDEPAQTLAYGARAEAVRRLVPVLREALEERGLTRLFEDVEMPLLRVLAEMELTGVGLDVAGLEQMSIEFGHSLDALTHEIYTFAGEAFNVNSTQQLGRILFEKLRLQPVKKTPKGQPSTDAEALEALAEEHPIVAKVLEQRTLVKLKGTYIDGLRTLVNPDTGRIHTSFNQMVTATGRLSSSDPNLQNIPVREDLGRKIRKVFVPTEPGWLILAADYSQIELRILAHLSADPVLCDAFHKGEDVHRRTAAEIFGLAMGEVSPEARDRAKAVNFGIVYGISDYGLSRNTGVARRDAKAFIESYFARYSGVKAFLDRVVAEAREKGYVTTVLNRRRYLPDINARNHNMRAFAERTAMNTPIQGSAADIIKLAMLNVQGRLEEKGTRSKMILQVHDELIFEVPPDELAMMTELVRHEMESAYALVVPLKVDLKVGPNWYDVKDID